MSAPDLIKYKGGIYKKALEGGDVGLGLTRKDIPVVFGMDSYDEQNEDASKGKISYGFNIRFFALGGTAETLKKLQQVDKNINKFRTPDGKLRVKGLKMDGFTISGLKEFSKRVEKYKGNYNGSISLHVTVKESQVKAAFTTARTFMRFLCSTFGDVFGAAAYSHGGLLKILDKPDHKVGRFELDYLYKKRT